MIISRDVFNSEHFGIEMGNVVVDKKYNANEFKCVLQNLPDYKIYKHLTLRIPTADKVTANAALEAGFTLCDTLVEWAFLYNKSVLKPIEHKVILRDCEQRDLDALKEIAKNSFKIDRFHSDPNLDNKLCDEYYEKWLENSYNGYAEKIIIAEYQGHGVRWVRERCSTMPS